MILVEVGLHIVVYREIDSPEQRHSNESRPNACHNYDDDSDFNDDKYDDNNDVNDGDDGDVDDDADDGYDHYDDNDDNDGDVGYGPLNIPRIPSSLKIKRTA
jgi:hypothetical protein